MEATGASRLTHPKSILVATDLSDLHRLMPFALQMASETGARLELLHVLPISAEFTADAFGLPYYDCEGAHACANNMLEPWCERARKMGLQCTAMVRESHPAAREIIAAVRQLRPDRLLLGTRSRGMLGKLLLGSVAEQLLRLVRLPVFIVGPEANLPPENSNRQPTVLFATTLGDGYEANAALACQFAASQRARLLMLHVLPARLEERCASCTNVLHSTIMYELQHLASKIGPGSGANVDIKLAHGVPAVEILAEASANQASFIVMSTADHSMLDNIIHDRTVCKVLANAPCPVLSLHGAVANRIESCEEVLTAHEAVAARG
jgi:nucleotide-binding universal stress UspA family protein